MSGKSLKKIEIKKSKGTLRKTGVQTPVARVARAPRKSRALSTGVIATRIRHARFLRGLRMIELAEKVGCSESMISKIETGQAQCSINMLHRIAAALGIGLSHFFPAEQNNDAGTVMRRGERPVISSFKVGKKTGLLLERLIPFYSGCLLQANLHTVEPGSGSEGAIRHSGEEMGYVLEGVLELTINKDKYLLQKGDSFYFQSEKPHSYGNPGKVPTKVIWVNTPPTY
jgi:transcriptional regulator with XRE-family HTH domain